eukprot:g2099.t1
MVELNLPQLGYTYVNLDDDWAIHRDPVTKRLIADPQRFRDGTLESLAEYVHSKNLKFGTYTDRGNLTCGGRPGSADHESIDAQTFADWKVDYLKEDSCYSTTNHTEAFALYARMRDALNETGRPILFSLCGWNPWYAYEPNGGGSALGNSWRIGPDDTNWAGILQNIDINANLSEYAGPGGFNDPCLLLAEDGEGKQRVTERQTRFQYTMWAIMSSPLLISANLRNMSAANIETYTNSKVIAVNQDPLAKQGVRVVGGALSEENLVAENATNVWAKRLHDGSAAVAFVNVGATAFDVKCDAHCWLKILPEYANRRDVACARNLWDDTEETVALSEGLTVYGVEPEGGAVLMRVGPC